MTKGRKTTYEERIEIIQYCIEHENNYAETAEKYHVSYQQVYSWIKNMHLQALKHLLIEGVGKKQNQICLNSKDCVLKIDF